MAKVSVIETGGTFSMGMTEKGLAPMYGIQHFSLAMLITESDLIEEKKNELYELLKQSGASSPGVGPVISTEQVLNKFNEKTGQLLTLEDVTKRYGFNGQVSRPYFIDSIDFSFTEHYRQLKEAVFTQIAQGNHPVVIGGTDTLEFYGQAIARDPEYQTLMQSHPEAKAVFVSSMKGFGDSPQHIAKIFKGALQLVEHGHPGIYAISASDVTVGHLTVHDLQQHVVKISSIIPDAFRSFQPVGTLSSDGVIHYNPLYKPKAVDVLPVRKKMQDVAAPLITKNSTKAIVAYLQRMPNHAVIIEGGIPDADDTNQKQIVGLIQERSKRDIPTIFVNDCFYNLVAQEFQSVIPQEQWGDSPFLQSVKEAGGVVLSDTTTVAAYLDTLFGKFHNKEHVTLRKPYEQLADASEIGVRYVPHPSGFNCGIRSAASIAPKVVIRSLPGEALPARHLGVVKEVKMVQFFSGFKYNGEVHTLPEGEHVIEGTKENNYAAAQEFRPYVMSLGATTPRAKLEELRAEAALGKKQIAAVLSGVSK